MHCQFGTNNRAPRWSFTDPCKPEVRPGVREESASPAWLAAPTMEPLAAWHKMRKMKNLFRPTICIYTLYSIFFSEGVLLHVPSIILVFLYSESSLGRILDFCQKLLIYIILRICFWRNLLPSLLRWSILQTYWGLRRSEIHFIGLEYG